MGAAPPLPWLCETSLEPLPATGPASSRTPLIDVHNSTIGSVGSSSADPHITPHQRLTLRQPKIMDIASFGCQAVGLLPAHMRPKSDLTLPGIVGTLLGRTPGKPQGTSWDIFAGGRIFTSSSVQVNEENFPWLGDKAHRPLLPTASRARQQPSLVPLGSDPSKGGGDSSSNSEQSDPHSLRCLNLFSGPYSRSDGLTATLKSQFGWHTVDQIDNCPSSGGGWWHDLLNDETYTFLLSAAKRGGYDAMVLAFPCSTFSVSRFFPSDPPGPTPIRDRDNPNGFPENQLSPDQVRELRQANSLLDRTVNIAIAARNSRRHTTIVFENPADRSIRGANQFSEDVSMHGAVFATDAFKRLTSAIPLSSKSTFAYCRFNDGDLQKYTTLWYTNDAAPILDTLNDPEFQCNHKNHPKVAGGRRPDGSFASSDSAAYPTPLCIKMACALTLARTGDPRPISMQHPPIRSQSNVAPAPPLPPSGSYAQPAPPTPNPVSTPSKGVADTLSPHAAPYSPITFPALGPKLSTPDASPNAQAAVSPLGHAPARLPQGRDERPSRHGRRDDIYKQQLLDRQAKLDRAAARRRDTPLPTVNESPDRETHSAQEDADASYVPFDPDVPAPASVDHMEAFVIDLVYDSTEPTPTSPLGPWMEVNSDTIPPNAVQTSDGYWVSEVEPSALSAAFSPDHLSLLSASVFKDDSSIPPERYLSLYAALADVNHALRADSSGAPSTHAQAIERGEPWPAACDKEINNHLHNNTRTVMERSSVPHGRRIHKLVWVFKEKRDGTAKARLCVQGCTLQPGVDFDQVFSSTLRHSSARALFAYGVRNSCYFRSVDFVAAYLQGSFVDGEVVYCWMPDGYTEKDTRGQSKVCRIDKPIYGIQQSGRRLQRRVAPWLISSGLRCLDDSDDCLYVYDDPSGKERFAIGIYVDNIQIAHSTPVDEDGVALDPHSFYAKFMTHLSTTWEIVDEGPTHDLLGIEVEPSADGQSIFLHQASYVDKLLSRFLPIDHPRLLKLKASRDGWGVSECCSPCLPDLNHVVDRIVEARALAPKAAIDPTRLRTYQEKVGALMYLSTSTRPDIAYPVNQLCRVMSCPAPELDAALDQLFVYLHMNRRVGLTYAAAPLPLTGAADASWEEKFSTSGWTVNWQGASISWASRKQNSVSLTSCEAEIIALSESAKDVVYFRKMLSGFDPSYVLEPTDCSTDNKGAHDIAYNPEHHSRIKHISRRHFFVRDMVEKGELVVPLVKTEDNAADMFTKPLHGESFFKFRSTVMNLPRACDD